jgi:hypothetical protein
MVIFPFKVLNLSNRGEPDNLKPFGFCRRAFYFYEYFPKKEGFLKDL